MCTQIQNAAESCVLVQVDKLKITHLFDGHHCYSWRWSTAAAAAVAAVVDAVAAIDAAAAAAAAVESGQTLAAVAPTDPQD